MVARMDAGCAGAGGCRVALLMALAEPDPAPETVPLSVILMSLL